MRKMVDLLNPIMEKSDSGVGFVVMNTGADDGGVPGWVESVSRIRTASEDAKKAAAFLSAWAKRTMTSASRANYSPSECKNALFTANADLGDLQKKMERVAALMVAASENVDNAVAMGISPKKIDLTRVRVAKGR